MTRSAWLAFSAVLIWMFFFYHRIFLHPNETMFVVQGDGIKAYTVYAGHIKNDPGYLDYVNMNYPYGQSYIFTDGQFAIANAVKFLARFTPWFETHSVGIYNLLILFSFPFCAFFLALILCRLRLPGWYAGAAAFCMTVLAPQIFRLEGHLTLAYACCIPFCWWLLICFFETHEKWKYAILSIVASTTLFFIHPYYTIIISFFIFCFFLVWLLTTRPARSLNRQIFLGLLLQIFLPILLTQGFLLLTDHHAGRPVHPYGFWENFANASTVFVPTRLPFYFLFQKIFGLHNQHWEGWAYIGLVLDIFLIYSVWRILRNVLRLRFRKIFRPAVPQWLGISAWASVIVLLYAMALPFRFKMDFLLYWFPIIHQFRALGRFAWIFFFVFSVFGYYGLWQLYRYYKIKGFRIVAILLLSLVFLIPSTEAWFVHGGVAATTTENINYFKRKLLTADYSGLIDAVDSLKKKYQCLVPLPFYHIGSDNFTTEDQELSLQASMVVSYWSNVPLLASSSARCPIPEARNILQFFSYPFIQKDISKDLHDARPFLVLHTRELLDIQETYWLSRSQKLWENNTFELWKLDADSVFTSTADREWNSFDRRKDSLLADSSGWLKSRPGFFYCNSFDDLKSDHVRRGAGARMGLKNEDYVVIDRKRLGLEPERDYVLSYWYYNVGDAMNQYDLVISETDSASGQTDWKYYFSPVRIKNIDGDWSLVEGKFRISDPSRQVSVFFRTYLHMKQTYYADELMIRPADCDVYRVVKHDAAGRVTEIIKNNYTFTRN